MLVKSSLVLSQIKVSVQYLFIWAPVWHPTLIQVNITVPCVSSSRERSTCVCVCERFQFWQYKVPGNASAPPLHPFSSLQSNLIRGQIRLHLTPSDAIWEAEERSFYTMLFSVMAPTWRRAGAREWGLTAPYVKETFTATAALWWCTAVLPSLLSSYLPFFFLSYLLPSLSSSIQPPPP